MTTAYCQLLQMKNRPWDQRFGFICCWLDKYSVNLEVRREGRKEVWCFQPPGGPELLVDLSCESKVELCCCWRQPEGLFALNSASLSFSPSALGKAVSGGFKVEPLGLSPTSRLSDFLFLPQDLQLEVFQTLCSVFVMVHIQTNSYSNVCLFFTLLPQAPIRGILNKEGKKEDFSQGRLGWSIYHVLMDQSYLFLRAELALIYIHCGVEQDCRLTWVPSLHAASKTPVC